MVLVRHIVDIQVTPLTLEELLAMAQADEAEIMLVEGDKSLGRIIPPKPEDAAAILAEREKQERVRQFQQAAREMGEAVAELGLTEEDVDAIVEEVRQKMYDERHGRRISETED